MEEKEPYSFVNETIKKKPLNKKKILKKTALTIVSAIVFGVVACATFFVLVPMFGSQITTTEEPERIVLPEEEEETDVNDFLTEDQPEQFDSTPIKDQITEQIEQEVSDGQVAIKTYGAAYDELFRVAYAASESIVMLTGVRDETDWFQNEIENTNETTGVIMIKTEDKMYIVADASALGDYEKYVITLNNGLKCSASFLSRDMDTGLGIFVVDKEDYTGSGWDTIQIAKLGNSRTLTNIGRPIIVLSNPLGLYKNITYGFVTSNESEIKLADYHYAVLNTDVVATSYNSSGVILNAKGQIIGILAKSSMNESEGGLITALGISGIRTLIEQMTNEEIKTYMGIYGDTVTQMMTEEMGIPAGIYVTEVEVDSPALAAGVMSGDVIVRMNDVDVSDTSEYMTALRKVSPGDEMTMVVKRNYGASYKTVTIVVTVQQK